MSLSFRKESSATEAFTPKTLSGFIRVIRHVSAFHEKLHIAVWQSQSYVQVELVVVCHPHGVQELVKSPKS